MTGSPTLNGPLGLVGAGYIGHLFAQHFALAGYEVRAWSPGASAGTLRNRLRQSVSMLAETGAVAGSSVDDVLARVSAHDDLATALGPCAAVMESIVEDAAAKSACYRDIETVVGPEVLLWSSTSNFPMTRLAADMTHPERAVALGRPLSTRPSAQHRSGLTAQPTIPFTVSPTGRPSSISHCTPKGSIQ